MVVRTGTARDVGALLRLKIGVSSRAFEGLLSPAQLREFIAGECSEAKIASELADPSIVYLVVERDARIVAMSYIQTRGTAAFLHNNYCSEPGSGIGTRLLLERVALARRWGHTEVRANAFACNLAARRLFERQGFTTSAERPGALFPGVPVVDFCLALDPR